MATAQRQIARKHLRLDAPKIKCAQRPLRTDTETETIERALDVASDEYQGNRTAREANERFLRSGIEVKEVYGKLAR
ncbi:MAG: hypothetical protein ABSB82_24040 [Terriglobia bacterium]|jgi:hypothetical protein